MSEVQQQYQNKMRLMLENIMMIMEPEKNSIYASLLTSLSTGFGALPVLFFQRNIENIKTDLMGIGYGVMSASIALSLVIPGIINAIKQGYNISAVTLIMVTGLMIGWYLFWLIHQYLFNRYITVSQPNIDVRILLFILAITLHNIPEGLIVGVGFHSNMMISGTAIVAGVGLQNIPEGLVVALYLRSLNKSASCAVLISYLTSLTEPIGSLLGSNLVKLAQPLLPLILAFAAGSMLFTLINEVSSEVNNKTLDMRSLLGVIMGFLVMSFFDVVLSFN